jgi:2-alkenal reductase
MDLSLEQRGVLVASVTSGSPADEAGLRGSNRQASIDGLQVSVGGDVIVAIDGEEVRTFEQMVSYLARNTSVGQTVTLTILRDGQRQDIPLTLGARPGS